MASPLSTRLVRASLLLAIVGLVISPPALAKGRAGGAHRGGHAPKMHAPVRPSFRPRQAPRSQPHAPRAHTPKVAKPHAAARPGASTPSTANRAPRANNGRAGSAPSRHYGAHRAYGRARLPYRHYGSYGRRRYGTNRYNGAIVSRLRSAHATLARADHDYRGHRVRAMHAIRSAIRQLSYSSGRRFGMSATGLQRVANRNNGGGRRAGPRARLPQAQSDALMRRAGQTLRLVSNHMASQGGSARTARAYGHVNRAIQHINTGLAIR